MAKPKQLDLIEYIAKRPQGEQTDIVTGELFQPKARNHYEENDGVPHAPAVDLPRPTLRQRIENLTRNNPDLLARYVHDGTPETDFEIPEDADTPLTPSEKNYLDMVAADVAERAPLPDEGLPRQTTALPSEVPLKADGSPGGGAPAATDTVPASR